MTTLIVAGSIRIAAEDIPAARALIGPLMAATREEPGNVAYVMSEDLNEPGLFHIFERWETRGALDSHFTAPHMATFNAGMKAVTVLNMSVRLYEVSADQDLMIR